MARIPDSLDLAIPQGAPPSTAVVAPTDFGLGQAAQEAELVARGQRRVGMLQVRAQAAQDRQAVGPDLVGLQGQLNDSLTKDAATYDGSPGFVDQAQNKALSAVIDARTALAKRGATPGQLSEFDNQAQALVLRHGQSAYEIQTKVQAAPIAEAFANAQTAQINGGLTDAQAAIQPAIETAKQNYTSGDPIAFRDGALASFDTAATAAVGKLPPNLQPKLAGELQQLRLKTAGDLTDFALQHQQAGILKQASDQLATGLNTIVTSPSAYENFVAPGGTLERVLSTLPAGLQADARHEYLGKAAASRIQGLIDAHQGAIAEEELKSDKYDAVLAPNEKESLYAKVINDGPDAVARGAAQWNAEQNISADLRNRAAGGPGVLTADQVNADVAAGVISAEAAGHWVAASAQASKNGLAAGPVYGMSNAQLAAAAAEPKPPPTDVAGTTAWEARQQAVADESKARAQPGAWVFSNAVQKLNGQPLGVAMAGKWQAATSAQGPARAAAMTDYAGTMLQVQMQAGIGPNQRQLVPEHTASALAASVVTAPPEGRLAAMQSLAGLVFSLPTQLKLTDGSIANPRAMLAAQLAGKGGLTPIEASAIADFGSNPAALGRVVAALNNTALKGPAPKGDQIPALVKRDLAPFLASDPAGDALAAGRIQRTILVARELQSQGLAPESAAGQAAGDLTGGYSFTHSWRMPADQAAAQVMVPGQLQLVGGFPVLMPGQVRGDKAADIGSAHILAGLTANGGAGLFAPSTVGGNVAQRQAIFASQIAKSGQWKTLPDDSGLMLSIPKPDGTWTAVHDKWGRPVQATWAQLQGVAQGQASPFATPPPTAVKTSEGAPVRAFSRSEGFAALAGAVQWQETRNDPARISPAGAIGAMQLTPDTGARYAAQLGLPWDPDRALHDVAYNRQIGNAALADLVARYGTGAGLGLALAAYNAGEGRVSAGWHDKTGAYHAPWLQTIGDPRSGQISLQDWVSRIPYKETRDYVGQVLAHAVSKLHGDG